MIDRFKRFLEREFKAIRPTQAAMDYREDLLTQLLEKEQDLRIISSISLSIQCNTFHLILLSSFLTKFHT